MATIEDFGKLDIRIGKVLDAVHIEDSEKLLKLTVDIGGEEKTILAGIAKHYDPTDLMGKQVVVVANLEPKKMMGEVSEGMILAAGEPSKIVLLQPENEIETGTKVR